MAGVIRTAYRKQGGGGFFAGVRYSHNDRRKDQLFTANENKANSFCVGQIRRKRDNCAKVKSIQTTDRMGSSENGRICFDKFRHDYRAGFGTDLHFAGNRIQSISDDL